MRANRVTHEDRDQQVKIREGLKPDRLKMDFTPVEFRKWKAQVSTFFEASNLQHASMKEQQDKVRHIQSIPSKKS